MKTTKMTATQAHEKLQQGGMYWILFRGDDMDASAFVEWNGTALTEEEAAEIDRMLESLDADEALEVTA